jgi:glucoamylase
MGLKPKSLDWDMAATVPLSALTAWQVLFVHAGLRLKGGANGRGTLPWKRVLVTAASGGVGVWLVQLGKLAGCEVVGTCGTGNVEFVKGLGATEVVDYQAKGLKEWVEEDEKRKVDVVIDCVGGKVLEESWSCIKDGGILISIVQPPEQKKPADWAGRDVTHLFFIVTASGKQLEEVAGLLEQDLCKPVLDTVFPFEDYQKALIKRLVGTQGEW